MFFLDFGSLWVLTYLLVGMLNVIPSPGEKAALSFALALGLKSLILFGWMVLGMEQNILVQTGLSLVALIFVFFFRRKRATNLILPSRFPEKKSSYFTVMVFILGALFFFSLANAIFFPITESDGIWYHIRGMVFLRDAEFDSQTIVSQFRQYPPFVPLLFAYLMSFDFDNVRIIFPFIYLCLLVIFYYRVYYYSNSGKIAAAFTLVLGTTPYFWWHSFLPFLDLTTGFYYSIGAMYWFFLIQNVFQREEFEGPESKICSLAFLSGSLFGLAAWSRLEFLLYNAIPLLILIYVLDRNRVLSKKRKKKILLCLAIPLLVFSSLWFATLLNFDSSLERRVQAVGLVCVGMWSLVLLFLKWDFHLKRARLVGMGASAIVLYIALMVTGGPQSVSLGKALMITLFRSISVHAFYLCTLFLGIFLLREKLRKLSEPKKILGWLLVFYPVVHFLIFSYSEPKWIEISTYFEALFVHPGQSINLSDTRGMIAFYPILIFFIAGLPLIKRGFKNE
ncbi:MAG: hypothetical protein IID17_09765 [Nitrospinae bacterium]|nr:hypothetical protein [Nitrospinota bacterium]